MLGAFALTAMTVSAGTVGNVEIVMDDFEVVPGNTAWTFANIYAEHDNYFSAIELHFALIDGITFNAGKPQNADMTQPWPVDEFDEDITWAPASNTDLAAGEFKIVLKFDVNNADGLVAYFPPGRTLLCRLAVKASADFTGATLHLNYCKTDYSDPGAPDYIGIAEQSDADICQIKVPGAAATPLATIVAEGVDDTEYTVEDALAVVAKGENCVFVTDGNDTWIKVAAEGDVFTTIAAMSDIKGGTLVGTLSEANRNQTLTVTKAPEEATDAVTYEKTQWNLKDANLPKVNSVILMTGYWFNGEFRGYANGHGQSATANFAWCEGGEPEMQEGVLYEDVNTIVQLKNPVGAKADADFQNLEVYPTAITNDNVVTGVESLNGDKTVVSVQYVNVAGQVANTPFEGMNMVVTRYADGSTKTTKVIK